MLYRQKEGDGVGPTRSAAGIWLGMMIATISAVGIVVLVGGWWSQLAHASGTSAQARYMVVAAITSAGIAVLGWWAVQRLEQASLRDVAHLVHWIDDVEDGNWDALPVPDNTMWGALAYALNRMADRLSSAGEARHQFLASVAHELKTPLTVLSGNLEGLAAGVLMPTPERWTALHREVTRLTRLVNDLLWLERAEGLTPPLQRTAYNPREQIEAILLRFRPLADSQGLNITVMMEDIPRVWADRDRIEQVLINILDNALRHTPTGKSIRIILTEDKSRVVCWCVEDAGPGIDPALRNHVREAFVRDPRSPGAGLGLAVADAWLRAHGGRLRISASTLGGARVCACIPGLRGR